MTKTSDFTTTEHSEHHVLRWTFFPLSLIPLFALATYDWHAIATLQAPPAPHSNWIGALGNTFAYYGYLAIGLVIWIVPLLCILSGLAMVSSKRLWTWRRTNFTILSIIIAAALAQLIAPHAPGILLLQSRLNLCNAGGLIGHLLTDIMLAPIISTFGAAIILSTLLGFTTISAIGFTTLRQWIATILHWALMRENDKAKADTDTSDDEATIHQQEYLAALQAKTDAKRDNDKEKKHKPIFKRTLTPQPPTPEVEVTPPAAHPKPPQKAAPSAKAAEPSTTSPYILPGIDLLAPLQTTSADHSDVDSMSKKLVDTLQIFGVDATMSFTVKGPVVTKYALKLKPGIRYGAVKNLSDNLMGALHAKSLRIEAPIPGKEEVGIEVPNARPAGISFREIFESDKWHEACEKCELPLLFGKDAAGDELIADLASMPHMLVAGATGQGKSVCLNSLICGLLMTRSPEQLKLIMVDPKSVEFAAYSAIPHLLVPVISDNNKVVKALMWAVVEMDKRLKLFVRARVRNIYDFNHRRSFTQTDMFGNDTEVGSDMPKTIPYIVIIIDEVADLMSQCAKVVAPPIQRIAQKARAAGIHLILATQRPDAKIITGAIKANIPGRVAFKCSTGIDSRTILDEAGAENLIGRGDMLFRGKDNTMRRAQGAWISDEEIANITGFIEQHAHTQFDDKFASNLARVQEAGVEDPFADLTPEESHEAKAAEREKIKLEASASDFKKAVECVMNTKRASVSYFQRQLGWGYNHAAKILDLLAERGVVSPPEGIGPRRIIMDENEMVAILQDNNKPAEGEDSSSPVPIDENNSLETDLAHEDPQPDLFAKETES